MVMACTSPSLGRAFGWLAKDVVARQAVVRPRNLAVHDLTSDVALDYARLDEAIDACAIWLTSTTEADDRVALLARNSLDHVVLFYACARAGRVFVPLNWRLAAAELAVILADAEPATIIVQPEFESLLRKAGPLGCPAVVAQADLADLVVNAPGSPLSPIDPERPWTLLYTSGTTGRPKGVIITARSAAFAALSYCGVSGLGADDSMLCDPPLFHVVALLAVLHGTLTAGGQVLISDRFDPGTTLERLSDPGLSVTRYFCVPQMAQAMADHPAFAAADLTRLKALYTGGAPLPAALIEAYDARGVLLVNGYGMTEAGTVLGMPPDRETIRAAPTSCGAQAAMIEVRLVGPGGADVSTGKVGEIWLRGPSVTPGYWRQPEATAAAFEGDWFRTGDAARRDNAGLFHIVDRWKDMYISGGENVYPAEIEAALLRIEGVREAAVVGMPSSRWGEAGCAFLILDPGTTLTAEAVMDACRDKLAGYKRPAEVRFVADFPRTASGKVQKGLLKGLLLADRGAA